MGPSTESRVDTRSPALLSGSCYLSGGIGSLCCVMSGIRGIYQDSEILDMQLLCFGVSGLLCLGVASVWGGFDLGLLCFGVVWFWGCFVLGLLSSGLVARNDCLTS